VSLHNPFPDERLAMMPIEKAYSIVDVLSEIRKYDFTGQRRVSFEYTMFKGENDQIRHIQALAKLLEGLECRINLIRYHSVPESGLMGTEIKQIEWFRDELNKRGITTTIRKSRGEDIYAACGLLSTKKKNSYEKL
jgi:23S rRNA (adenine2503-C2)-methyltransferase